MPIVKIEKTKYYTYAFWDIQESLSEMMENLKVKKSEIVEIQNIKHVKRKKQNIAARLILNHFAMRKVKLLYLKNGSPYCKNFQHISISHSHNYSAVAISNYSIGIDIQYLKPNIKNLQKKFINKLEERHLNKIDNTSTLHYIWCAKEAIYKNLNLFCSLKENIYIKELPQSGLGCYKDNNTTINYNIYWEMFDNYFVAIATKKI